MKGIEDRKIPNFVYPDDNVLALVWRNERRISFDELDECFRIQRAEAPPPRTLKEIAETMGITARFTGPEAVVKFEAEAQCALKRDRVIREKDLRGEADFFIVRKMGEGGQGEIFLAQQRSPNRLVVLKRLPEILSYEGRCVYRFFEEAIILERAESKGVVELYEYGMAGDSCYIVMEYVVGESLPAYLKRMKRLPIKETIEILLSLCDTFAGLAEAGVVHCDVKPSNVMLPLKGVRTKLIDFGAAVRAETKQESTGGWVGSPAYMAPEQFRHASLSPLADMYALGVTAFQLLTGRLPFEDTNPLALGRRHISEPFPSIISLLHDLPVQMSGIINKMCAKSPGERYKSFKELKSELDKVYRKQ